MMLDARSSEFRRLYPNYCHVYDARGRRIHCVTACNPMTGEVIRYETTDNGNLVMNTGPFRSLWRPSSSEFAYFFLGIPWLKVSDFDLYNGNPRTRHGFWPAPLQVVPLGGPVPTGVPYRVGDEAREQRVDFAEAPRPAELEALKGAMERANKLMAGLALPDELINPAEDRAREQRAAIDAIEESVRPMLKRGEWLDAWREQRGDMPNKSAGIAYLDDLIDNAEGEE